MPSDEDNVIYVHKRGNSLPRIKYDVLEAEIDRSDNNHRMDWAEVRTLTSILEAGVDDGSCQLLSTDLSRSVVLVKEEKVPRFHEL